MPKDNEVDEKVRPVAWVERTEGGLTRMWSGDLSAWAHRPANPEPLYSQATIDALRGEVERLETLLAAIRPYAQHADSCGDMDAYNNASVESCGCGLDSLLDAASDALTKESP